MDEERPALLQRRPLTGRERGRVLLVALGPVVLAALILVPMALLGPATVTDALVAAAVYGGLMGLAAGFVVVDRLQARQCPRCGRRRERADDVCLACGYDLEEEPRFVCSERHRVHVEPGVCRCGRRLQRVETPRGVGREVVAVLRIGAWLLAFLVGVGVLLRLLG